MKKIACIFLNVLLALVLLGNCATGGAAGSSGSAPSYYVNARGDNNNDGLSERNPLKSLTLAYQKAAEGTIKRITVIGTLDYRSEGEEGYYAVFELEAPWDIVDDSEILITGKPGASGASRAVLSGVGSKKEVVHVFDITRFEHIEISGGELNADEAGGVGIFISVSTATIGPGTVVRANKGTGVYIADDGIGILTGGDIRDNEDGGVDNCGVFYLESGTIRNNKRSFGGGVDNLETFIMSGGSITGNTGEQDGGGVYNEGTFIMSGGNITNNTGGREGGGVNNEGTFTMSNGNIANNTAVRYGGGICNWNGTFTMSGGSITSNLGEEGGGVYNEGTFTMSNGSIADNRADEGGGVANNGTFTMSGGNITNNTASEVGGGVYIGIPDIEDEFVFTMTGGNIANNRADLGGGVYVYGVSEEYINEYNGGIFKQSGGSITGNRSRVGGGVFVDSYNGRYDQTGGTVSNNSAQQYNTNAPQGFTNNANINRVLGSLGSNR